MHEVTELAGHAGEISYLRGLQRGMDNNKSDILPKNLLLLNAEGFSLFT